MFKLRDRCFESGNIHHAIHHDLGKRLRVYTLHNSKKAVTAD